MITDAQHLINQIDALLTENAKLRALLTTLVEREPWDEYGSGELMQEYCVHCEHDTESTHAESCAYVAARALLDADA